MIEIPKPPVPAHCDLRDFPYMRLYIARLRRSKSWLLAKKQPELGFYMMNLWSASWHSLPASSLEYDDDLLADQAMCDARRWAKVKEGALHGWALCAADGLIYHPVVAEIAIEAWDIKLAQRSRTEAARQAREEKRRQRTAEAPTGSVTDTVTGVVTDTVTDTVTEDVTDNVTSSKREREGEREGEKEESLAGEVISLRVGR